MQMRCPAAWKAFGNREWYKERKRAVQMFRELLPFLPESEYPASMPTKGRRSKQEAKEMVFTPQLEKTEKNPAYFACSPSLFRVAP
jgi:hypothetical protein